MITAFQIILLFIISISFISMFTDPKANQQNQRFAFVCLGAIIAFCISIMFF